MGGIRVYPGRDYGKPSQSWLTQWWTALGILLKGMLFAWIVSSVGRYYGRYGHSDGTLTRAYIGSATIVEMLKLGLLCVQLYEQLHHAADEYQRIMPFDVLSSIAMMTAVLYIHVPVAGFFAWRAWKLSERKWWLLPPLTAAVAGVLGTSLPSLIIGFSFPLEVSLATLPELLDWSEKLKHILPYWAYGGVACDSFICLTTVYYLLRNKNSVMRRQQRLLRKLVSLVLESMLPPTILLVLLATQQYRTSAVFADWRRSIFSIISSFYFYSLPHSLNSRERVKRILQSDLEANGVLKLSMPTESSVGGGQMFPYPSESPVDKGDEKGTVESQNASQSSDLRSPASIQSFGSTVEILPRDQAPPSARATIYDPSPQIPAIKRLSALTINAAPKFGYAM